MKGVIKLQWQHVATANGLAESRSLGASSPGKGFALLVAPAGQRESLFPGQAPSHLCHAQRKRSCGLTRSRHARRYCTSEQNINAFVKKETFHKSLLADTSNITGENGKGSSQFTNGITFWICFTSGAGVAKLNDLGKGLWVLLWLPFLLNPFSAARSLGSLCARISDAVKERQAFIKL